MVEMFFLAQRYKKEELFELMERCCQLGKCSVKALNLHREDKHTVLYSNEKFNVFSASPVWSSSVYLPLKPDFHWSSCISVTLTKNRTFNNQSECLLSIALRLMSIPPHHKLHAAESWKNGKQARVSK